METMHIEHRREPRFQIAAGTTVEMHSKGQIVSATTVNMSGCGVLLELSEAPPLALGDEVMCEFKLPQEADASLPLWGLGTVVRLDDRRIAVDLRGGIWTQASSSESPPDQSR
jgi:hypothetical protein